MQLDSLAAACRDTTQIYPSASGAVAALRGVDAQFPYGTITVIVGPSGAGKSTFLRVLACLEQPAAGEVWIGGTPTASLNSRKRRRFFVRRLSYVFQRPLDNLISYLTVRQHVEFALVMRSGRRAAHVDDVLEATGLAPIAARRPGDLSAGEQQGVAFAMAVAGDPTLVVADEPTAEVDAAGRKALVALLATLARENRTFVVASHDPAVIDIADQVLVVRNGSIAATLTPTGDEVAIIDAAGRIQLPEQTRDLFPSGRARIEVSGDDVRLREP